MRPFLFSSVTRPMVTRRRLEWLQAPLMVVACVAVVACSGVTNVVTPYKIDILQGNVVTKEQAQTLQPGQARDQVKAVLGSPLLTSVFHGDRWDYVFTLQRQGQPAQQRRLTVFFKGDVLDRVESDELPSEADFVSSLDSRRKLDKAPPLEATEEQLKNFQARNANAVQAPSAAAPAVPATSYPPLETPGASR